MSRVFIEPSPDGGYQINSADGSPPHRGFTTQDEAIGTARLYGDEPQVADASRRQDDAASARDGAS